MKMKTATATPIPFEIIKSLLSGEAASSLVAQTAANDYHHVIIRFNSTFFVCLVHEH